MKVVVIILTNLLVYEDVGLDILVSLFYYHYY